MKVCEGYTKLGRKCGNLCRWPSHHCNLHQTQATTRKQSYPKLAKAKTTTASVYFIYEKIGQQKWKRLHFLFFCAAKEAKTIAQEMTENAYRRKYKAVEYAPVKLRNVQRTAAPKPR